MKDKILKFFREAIGISGTILYFAASTMVFMVVLGWFILAFTVDYLGDIFKLREGSDAIDARNRCGR
jgi:uncharacterized membrane protein